MLTQQSLSGVCHGLAAVALEIDSTKHLLALCLASKALYALAYERHLRFRRISCRLEDPKSLAVWKLLAGDKSLARSVRVLILQPLSPSDPRCTIPRIKTNSSLSSNSAWQDGTHETFGRLKKATWVITKFLAPALQNMSRLKEFYWRPPLPSPKYPFYAAVDDSVRLPYQSARNLM